MHMPSIPHPGHDLEIILGWSPGRAAFLAPVGGGGGRAQETPETLGTRNYGFLPLETGRINSPKYKFGMYS